MDRRETPTTPYFTLPKKSRSANTRSDGYKSAVVIHVAAAAVVYFPGAVRFQSPFPGQSQSSAKGKLLPRAIHFGPPKDKLASHTLLRVFGQEKKTDCETLMGVYKSDSPHHGWQQQSQEIWPLSQSFLLEASSAALATPPESTSKASVEGGDLFL